MSQGNEDAITQAKELIVGAIIGVIVIALAGVILKSISHEVCIPGDTTCYKDTIKLQQSGTPQNNQQLSP